MKILADTCIADHTFCIPINTIVSMLYLTMWEFVNDTFCYDSHNL